MVTFTLLCTHTEPLLITKKICFCVCVLYSIICIYTLWYNGIHILCFVEFFPLPFLVEQNIKKQSLKKQQNLVHGEIF